MASHIRWQILLILLGVALVGILLTYLALNYTTVLRPGRGGTYVEGIVGSPHYLNPLLSGYNEVDQDLCSLLFNGLTRFNERGEVVPDLARGWEITLDGQTYIFHLRDDARWHDGTRVTAEDVVFTLDLLKDPEFAGPPGLGAAVWQTVGVEKLDALTLRFVLPEPFAPFLDYTTVGILPSHLLEGVSAADLAEAEFNLSPVGSGPFRLAEEIQVEDGMVTSMVVEPFAAYHGAQPYLGRIQFRFYPGYQTAFDAYEAGEIEGIARIPKPELSRAAAFPSLNLFSAQMAEYEMILLNHRNDDVPFFQEREVRQALLYALDRQQIINQALGGQALVAHSPLIPGTWAYSEEPARYEHDPEQARDLLDQAGWLVTAQGAEVRRRAGEDLAFTLLTSSEPERVEVAQRAADQWSGVGITVTVATASPAEVREALESREFEAILVRMTLPGDPDPYPFWHQTQIQGGQNYAGFDHREMSEILERARVLVNRERRRDLYEEFQALFAEELPALPLYVPVYTYGVDERIHSVQMGPLMHSSDRFRTVSEWWIVPRRVFVSEAEAQRP